jgi:hypothetical protein
LHFGTHVGGVAAERIANTRLSGAEDYEQGVAAAGRHYAEEDARVPYH